MTTAFGTRTTHIGRKPAFVATGLVATVAVVFLVTRPPVGDLFAARARQSAADHGVGERYWFAWFGGTVPGHYSVLGTYLYRFVDVRMLGALATVLVVPLCWRLLRGTAHARLAMWLAVIGASANLWSGRVPFAVGTVVMLLTLVAIREDRRVLAVLAGAATALLSPVSGVFLGLGLVGVYLHDRSRRLVALLSAGATGLSLVGAAAYFGMPGPEGFPPIEAALTFATLLLMMLAKPAPAVRAVLVLSALACPVLLVVPNGMGSNFERLAWLCLPVAVAGTARARLPVAGVVVLLALGCAVGQTVLDLQVAAKPMSRPSYDAPLAAALDRIHGLANYRVEMVPDGTHVAAFTLLDHASLARGYETQSDNALNGVLGSPTLNATQYKIWLDNNAVGYVALDRSTLNPGPEDRLVRAADLPYLAPVWSNPHWLLYRVLGATPIVSAPGRVVDADQANLVIDMPAATVVVRVRWSRFLHLAGPPGLASVRPDGSGWTELTAPVPGRYVLTG